MISILYVDDEPGLLEIGRIFLEQTGEFRVDTVESGKGALALIRQKSYDAIVSDYQMPEMNGISLLKAIRQSAGDLPFILFTGRGREEVVIEAVNNGVDFYLQKGGDPTAQFAELMHKVRQAVSRKQAERDLRESEKRLTDIINFLPDATFAIDREGKVIAWNRAIEELTGVQAADMLGKGAYAYAVPFYGHPRPILIDLTSESEEEIRKHYSGIRRENEILIAETDLPRPRGKALTLMGKASPLYDREGRVAGAIESIRDITARKQEEDELRAAYEQIRATDEELRRQYETIARNEQVLRDSEEKYRTLVENSQDIIYIYRDDHILVVNRRGPELLGYTAEELKSMSIWDLLHPDDRTRVRNQGRARFSGSNLSPQYLARILTRSGKVIPMELAAVLITYQGEPAIMGIARDVTEREEHLAAMAKKTKTLTIINQIIQTASQKRDLDELLNIAITSTRELLGFEAGGIYLIDDSGARARIVCMQNLPFGFVREADDIAIADEPFSAVLVRGESVVSDDFDADKPALAKNFGFGSFASVPISSDGRVIGALNIATARLIGISSEDRDVLVTIGKELGSAIMRMRAETAREESEAQYRTLIETTGTGYVIINGEGRVVDANQEYVRMTGHRSLGEIKDRSVIEWTAAHDHDRNAEAIQECLRNGSIRNFDVDYVDGAGRLTPVEVNATVVDYQGSLRIVTLCRDISLRRKTEEALRESESTARALLNAPTDTILLLDPEGIILDLNETAVRTLGRKREDLIGALSETLLPPEIAKERRKKIMRVLDTGSPIRFVDQRQDIWFDNVVYPITDARGNVARLAIIARDITEQKKAEAALQKSAASLASIFRAAPVGIGVVSDRVITHANERLCEITGYLCEELVGKNARILYATDEDYAYVGDEKYRQIRAKGTGMVETHWKRKDGTIRDILLSSTPVDAAWPTRDVTFTALDITENLRARAGLQQAYEKLNASEQELRAQYKALAAAEATVRKKERQLHEITATIPGVVFQFLVTPAGKITAVYISERSRELFAIDSTPLSGVMERFTGSVHPEDRQGFTDSMTIASRNREQWNYSGRFIKPDGEVIWFQISASPVKTELGQIYSGVILDISARRKAEDAQRQTESLYGTIADEAQDLIYIIGKDDTVLYVNRFAARMMGRSKEDMIGRPRSALFSGPAGEGQGRNLRKVFESGKPRTIESRVPIPSGEVWQNTHLIPLRDAEGSVTAVLGISRDITSLKETEDALRHSEGQYRAIIDNMQDIFYRADLKGRLTMISPAGARMAGYHSPDEMIGLDIAQDLYVDPQQRKKFLALLDRQGSVTAFPILLRTRDGHTFHATASSHFYYDAQGRLAGIEGVVHDVTDLWQAEAALREANRKLNLLNSITRHDVANQLTVLQGYAQLANLKNADPVIGDFLQKIDSVATTIARQIEFSKTYQELGVREPGWFSLDAIFVRTKPKEILFSSLCSGIEIFSDPMLEKVFANLFGNSVMHGGHVSRISVGCETTGDGLVITVEDNGVGIPLNEKQKIFEKGYGKNTGFGLFLAREILAITGISIHETGKHGTGARFEITVPKGGFRQAGNGNA